MPSKIISSCVADVVFCSERLEGENDKEQSLAWKQDGRTYNKGPDQILPSSAIYTWHADGATMLSLLGGNGEIAMRTPISVPSLLEKAARRAPKRTALAIKRNSSWEKWTYNEYLRDVRNAAKGFIALGLEPYHSVCILGYNAPEWFISDLAAIHAGGFAAGIYTTSSPDACAFVVKDSKAQIVVVEDSEQLNKILTQEEDLSDVKAIIQYTGEPDVPNVYSWSQFMFLGEQQSDDILNHRLKHIAVNQCATLVYTSGTTGNPKGVMNSHDNHTWTAKVGCDAYKLKDCAEDFISFLPLCHAAAQFHDVYCALTCCASVYIADRNALKDSLFETMKEVQPTMMFAVPRVWEKLHDKIQDILLEWTTSKTQHYILSSMNKIENPNDLVHSQVKDALGLNRCQVCVTGGASIKPEIIDHFRALKIDMIEIFGMSETTGAHLLGGQRGYKIDGTVLPGMSTKLDMVDEDGNGEMCLGGRDITMGYFNQPEKTIETIDLDGWLHSGDIGKINEDGYMNITGRIKELVITAGGKNVAPVPIENIVKTELPIVSQAMVLGDNLKHLSILLTLKTEVDTHTLKPKDTLLSFAKEWINWNGDCDVHTVPDVLMELYENKNAKLVSAFQNGINEANTKAASNSHKIQKWHVLPTDFSVAGGELGPTLKVRRPIVVQKYQRVIDKLYS